MATFFMMIGPAGCGKSTYAEKIKMENTVILSSDDTRRELFGDEAVQSGNDKVFLTMTKRARQLLSEGKDVIWDSTNMSRKRRIGILKQLPAGTECVAILIANRIDSIIEQDKSRERTVGKDIIMKQIASFDPPWYTEGFESIIVRSDPRYTMDELTDMMKACSHDNPHHGPGSVWDHCSLMANAARRNGENHKIIRACEYHDCGKPFVKTFDEDGIAHYIGHDGVGAYAYLAAGGDGHTAVLIGEHMNMHQPGFRLDRLKLRIGDDMVEHLKNLKYYDETYR